MEQMLKWLERLDLRQSSAPKLKLAFILVGGLLLTGAVGLTYSDTLKRFSPLYVETEPNTQDDGTEMATVESLFDEGSNLRGPETFEDAQRCLAQAIYFEARSEPEPGWEAVADVVINRVRDKRYPSTICRVVFQGEYRRHSCQFSFACDGLSDRAKNARLWDRALEIAGAKLIASQVRADTALATHYHADYVKPYWSEKMVRLTKIGRHIFYTDRRKANF